MLKKESNLNALKLPTEQPNSDPTYLDNMKRILICAPSNAAVDELVLRLMGGVVGSDKKIWYPGIVRLGRSDVINSNVRELTLEELVDKRLEQIEKESNVEYNGALRKEQNENLAKRDALRTKQSDTENPEEREAIRLEIIQLTKKIKTTGHQLDIQREQLQVKARKRDIERRRAQTAIIKGSQVICATLSGSAHNVLSSLQMTFDTVIIDEAAQCIELSALIPLKYGCKQCIMVGDPNQLPPTVLSQHAASLKYEQSLFVRMFKQYPDRIHMLNVQFRMHPDIAVFPSKEFYDNKLTTGSTNFERTKQDWHNDIFSPYRFFNVKGSQERSERTKSLFNKNEAQVAYQLYKNFGEKIGYGNINGKVGIISPYKQQVTLLKNFFRQMLGNIGLESIDFNTIDGFQGQEKDIIILSCVRADPAANGVGFLSDIRRMNVAITRAKSSLWILGNEQSLVSSPVWARLIEDAKSRNMYSDYGSSIFNSDGKITHSEVSVHKEGNSSNGSKRQRKKNVKKRNRDDNEAQNDSGKSNKYPENSSSSKRTKNDEDDHYEPRPAFSRPSKADTVTKPFSSSTSRPIQISRSNETLGTDDDNYVPRPAKTNELKSVATPARPPGPKPYEDIGIPTGPPNIRERNLQKSKLSTTDPNFIPPVNRSTVNTSLKVTPISTKSSATAFPIPGLTFTSGTSSIQNNPQTKSTFKFGGGNFSKGGNRNYNNGYINTNAISNNRPSQNNNRTGPNHSSNNNSNSNSNNNTNRANNQRPPPRRNKKTSIFVPSNRPGGSRH